MTDARRAALLRLLEDWENGRMTPSFGMVDYDMTEEGWMAACYTGRELGWMYCLTPAGLAAARAEREKGE